ncbi:type 2 isopentenyl-diphosphate Delta-isomerase [Brevibacillus sp. FSL K6-0770]|uniref:type 2 isopentenyl-diphosphate Delta-isomerase n=1 Tax=unclassified Brevibacillus TaxID=2684853 RepID=UPI0024752C22|nr:type 2 isopentenyl-diphosphate Delta-isomerase [Brevibacillus sp. 1238]MDH6349201.1 isopentenyl-diphosphate delta-isomerase [Brevibacillus sp. 1238]
MDRSTRKLDHIRNALATAENGTNCFDDVSFVPNSVPNTGYEETKLATEFATFRLPSPFVINAMTGGAEATTPINQKLAIIARERQLAMAVGSQMAALRDPSLASSYQIVRKENPHGIIWANVGAEATVEQAKAAIDMLEADGLQIHLNVMQELLMPEGDRDFRGYLERIQNISEAVNVPVIVKEVGFGMTKETMRKLLEAGIRSIDVGGRGGTNFAKVENMRSSHPLTMFEDWGFTTVESLLEADSHIHAQSSVMATGGIRHGLDAFKAISLGAKAVGVAGALLRLIHTKSLAECLEEVDAWHHQIRVAMTALGIVQLADAINVPLLVTGKTAERARLRGIVLDQLAQR